MLSWEVQLWRKHSTGRGSVNWHRTIKSKTAKAALNKAFTKFYTAYPKANITSISVQLDD